MRYKKFKITYEEIIDRENIREAILMASKGKKLKAKKYIDNIEQTIDDIRYLLENNLYVPSDYTIFTKKEDSSGKIRTIHAPKFYPDQIIHWVLMNKLSSLFLRAFTPHTCACIKGRGVHYALKHAKIGSRYKYFLKFDIEKFFPSIDQEILIRLLEEKFRDVRILNLLNSIIRSTEYGLPLGNYTSQWLANFYLSEIDKKFFIRKLQMNDKNAVKHYVRYMDDIVLFGNNKRQLKNIFYEIKNYLNIERGLDIKPNWVCDKVDRGLDFVGFIIYRNGKTKIRKRNFIKLVSSYNYFKLNKNATNAYRVISYNGFLVHSNTYNLQKKLDTNNIIRECKYVISREHMKQ